jgi:hypothetical protein
MENAIHASWDTFLIKILLNVKLVIHIAKDVKDLVIQTV